MDVRKMFDKDYIYAYDLEGKHVTVEITKVVGGTLVGEGGKSSKKPVLYFKGTTKGLAVNITNARIIAGLYGGFDSEKWTGKRITLYPTTTTFGKQTVDCIRVKNEIPKSKGEAIRNDVPAPTTNEVASPAEAQQPAPPITAADIPFALGGR